MKSLRHEKQNKFRDPILLLKIDYNANGYLESISDSTTTYWAIGELNAKRQRLEETYSNGLVTSTSYHPFTGQISSIQTDVNASVDG